MPNMSFFSAPSLSRLGMLILVIVPVASWALVKPIRVVAPALAGASCPTAHICTDDVSQFSSASELYSEAQTFVSLKLSPLGSEPRIVFCAKQACADSFDLGDRSAVTVGTIGTFIGPHAWKPYYVRHELIHQLQAEQLGVSSILFKPSWFVEGMAYAPSEDPRPVLTEPWQTYRSQFKAWYGDVGRTGVWVAAAQL